MSKVIRYNYFIIYASSIPFIMAYSIALRGVGTPSDSPLDTIIPQSESISVLFPDIISCNIEQRFFSVDLIIDLSFVKSILLMEI